MVKNKIVVNKVSKTKARMTPPPPGAHAGEARYGFGMGFLVGVLLGLFIGAGLLLFFEMQRKDILESVQETVANQAGESKPLSSDISRPRIISNDVNNTTDAGGQNSQNSKQAPGIVATSPEDGARTVPADVDVAIGFDTDMGPGTFNKNTISVFSTNDLRDIADELRFNYHAESKQLTLEFDKIGRDFGSGNVIEITLSTGVKSQAGIALSRSYKLKFETQ